MKKLLLLLSIAFTLAIPTQAQFTFEKIDGTTGEDGGYEIIKTSDGGFAVAGTWNSVSGGEDAYLRKTDAGGNIVWERTYGGLAAEEAHGVVQTADGGYTLLFNNVDGGQVGGTYLLKTDGTGYDIWQKKVAPTTSVAFIQTSDGGYAITEEDPSGDTLSLIRTNSGGDILWTKFYAMPNNVNLAYDLIQTSDGGFAITGETNNQLPSDITNIFLLKTDLNGTLQWNKQFGTADLIDEAFALQQTSDGGYLIGGTTIDALSGASSALLIKTNNQGIATWTKPYNYDPTAFFYQIEDLTLTSDGNYMLCGWEGGFFGINGFLLEVNPQGDTLLNRIFSGQGAALLFSVIQDADGQFVCTGGTAPTLDDDSELYYFKTGFPVATKDLQQNNMRLDPNPVPAGQSLRISLEGISNYQLTLFDALGRLVWQKTGESEGMNVPAPTQAGIYALVATTKDGRFVGRYLLEVQ